MADRPDGLDEVLGSLGEGTPFPVDWEAYEMGVLARLARRERRRRLRACLAAATSAAAGAAAALLVAVVLGRPPAGGTARTGEAPSPGEAELGPRLAAGRATGTPAAAQAPAPARRESLGYGPHPPAGDLRHPLGRADRAPRTGRFEPGGSARIVLRTGARGEIRFDGFTPPGDDSPGLIAALAAAE